MPKRPVAAACVLLLALVTPDRVEARHTPTGCWAVPREYHEPYTDQFAKGLVDLSRRVLVGSVALADPPQRTPSENGAYWFAQELPDYTRFGPWTTRVLIFNERRTLVQLSFIDHDSGGVRVNWVNEKLLFIRAACGRIVATDHIFDVEKGVFIYREVVRSGQIAFQQWQQHEGPCVVPPGQFSK